MIKEEVTDRIIKAFYEVYNTLGHGFLEKVYENALAAELRNAGFSVETQKPINVQYKGTLVGEYFADICIDSSIIIELKSCETLNSAHETQLINYLKATDVEVGLLLNLGKKPEIRRKIYTQKGKK